MTSQLNYLIAQQRVHMNASYPTPEGVDPRELDELVDGMYDRGLPPETPRPAPPHSGALEAPGYPPLCAHGMSSLTERGYDVALGRLRRTSRPPASSCR